MSDPHEISLFQDGKAGEFTKAGVITFVLHKALRSMGPAGVHEDFSLISYISKNGTNVRLMNICKSDVSYPDVLSLEQPGSRLEL